jgi:hypothetical protein
VRPGALRFGNGVVVRAVVDDDDMRDMQLRADDDGVDAARFVEARNDGADLGGGWTG